MAKRGRKSVASLLVEVRPGERPDAPYSLGDEQSAEWRGIVASMPADYFKRSHYPVLVQLTRHIVASNRIAMLIEQLCRSKMIDTARFVSLHAQQTTETMAIIRLCRQLRLSPQQVYRPT